MLSSTHTGVRGLLLDIEGTTSSISFVHDVMFPYVLLRLDTFLASEFERPDVRAACEQMAIDAGYPTLELWSAAPQQQPFYLPLSVGEPQVWMYVSTPPVA